MDKQERRVQKLHEKGLQMSINRLEKKREENQELSANTVPFFSCTARFYSTAEERHWAG